MKGKKKSQDNFPKYSNSSNEIGEKNREGNTDEEEKENKDCRLLRKHEKIEYAVLNYLPERLVYEISKIKNIELCFFSLWRLTDASFYNFSEILSFTIVSNIRIAKRVSLVNLLKRINLNSNNLKEQQQEKEYEVDESSYNNEEVQTLSNFTELDEVEKIKLSQLTLFKDLNSIRNINQESNIIDDSKRKLF